MDIAHNQMLVEWVEGCKRHDRIAQRELYEYFYGRMMGVCLRYAGDREQASGILNQGFYKVFKNIERFDFEEGSLEAWIRRILINTAIDHYRKENRRKDTMDIEFARTASEEAAAVPNMNADQILELVQDLPPAYRTVFNLYVMEGYNHREIGEKLGISEGTSKSNLSKARAKLQKWITELNRFKNKEYAK